MENKKCENCTYWTLTTPPSIGKCRPNNKTTIFNHNCSQYEPNKDNYINDMFNDVFKGFNDK
jgi:hypothetical protein